MADRIEDRIEDVARTVAKGAGSVLSVVALVGWMGLWLILALVGWIFTWPTMTAVSAAIVALTLIATIVRRASRRRKLARQAENELVARARLEQVKLDRDLEDVLRAFDLSHKRVHEILERGDVIEESMAIEAAVDLQRVREHLFVLAKEKASLLRDLKGLGRSSRVEAVSAAIDDLRRRIGEKQREAERIAQQTQLLSERLIEVGALSSSATASVPERELTKILADLDHTAKAYREIEQAETETARRLRAARALRNAQS